MVVESFSSFLLFRSLQGSDMQYEIWSMLKIDRDTFIRVDEFSGKVPDKEYIKGAIHWRIGDVTILTDAHWDIVDLLWIFALDGLTQMLETGEFETCFPAQPLLLRFTKISSKQVRIEVGDVSTVVDFSLMIRSLCEGGRVFFEKMSELVPEFNNKWKSSLQKIDKIESVLGLSD